MPSTSSSTGTDPMLRPHNDVDVEENDDQSEAYTLALLRSLKTSGVQFLRYFTVDVCNNIRCKVKPIDHLLFQFEQQNDHHTTHQYQHRALHRYHTVAMAEINCGGLPYHTDAAVLGTGLDATNGVIVQPALQSLRILPPSSNKSKSQAASAANKSAIVMGTLLDQYTHQPSPFCTRSVLRRVVREAAVQHNIAFSVGIELEFCLVHRNPNPYADSNSTLFVDGSVFGNTTTLYEREEFIADLYEQLTQQYIKIELLHAESGPGQIEIVLEYIRKDPVQMIDNMLFAQETIKAVAYQHDYTALFLPKYEATQAGNGMHLHVSLCDATTGTPLFSQQQTPQHPVPHHHTHTQHHKLSPVGAGFVEGILRHLRGLLGVSMPTANSFRRVGPGCWTGSVIGWNLEDKDCGVRVCANLHTKEWDHVEFKFCDSSANLYLALAALLSSGLEGITQAWTLRPSILVLEQQDKARRMATTTTTTTAAITISSSSSTIKTDDTVDVSTSAAASSNTPVVGVAPIPGSLVEALDALEEDDHIMKLLGPRLSKAYLAVRRHEAERSSKLTLADELREALARS